MTSEPRPVREPAGGGEEERLRRENLDLKRRLQELQHPSENHTAALWKPSATTIWAIFLAACILVAIAFLAGFLPMQKRRALVIAEEQQQEHTLPRVDVVEVR